jgi:hypothetical protein
MTNEPIDPILNEIIEQTLNQKERLREKIPVLECNKPQTQENKLTNDAIIVPIFLCEKEAVQNQEFKLKQHKNGVASVECKFSTEQRRIKAEQEKKKW